ncbi:tetratricopeptide repeat protein [Rickettsia endosymbiont of Cantharis rufa]|uniref:tetratricopeptide repeat protein n=1 Tax=Rickettsia endosymbiont of Cantharis rufa TaxID=3066248 RepID=UPI0031332702
MAGAKDETKLYQGNHVAIATSLNNVGTTYDKLGYIFVSLKYFELGLKMFQELHQGNHHNIAGFLNNVGLAYHKLEDAYKALELYKQAYLMRVQTLGLDHPYTKELKSYLKENASEFIKNNETRGVYITKRRF